MPVSVEKLCPDPAITGIKGNLFMDFNDLFISMPMSAMNENEKGIISVNRSCNALVYFHRSSIEDYEKQRKKYECSDLEGLIS